MTLHIERGDTIIIGETRFTVLALSGTRVFARREGALPHEITYLERALLTDESVRIEPKEASDEEQTI